MQHIFELANCLYLFVFSYWKRPWQHTAIFPCLFDVHVFPRSAWIKWKVNFRWKSFNIHALCAINLSTYTIYLKYIRCIRLHKKTTKNRNERKRLCAEYNRYMDEGEFPLLFIYVYPFDTFVLFSLSTKIIYGYENQIVTPKLFSLLIT